MRAAIIIGIEFDAIDFKYAIFYTPTFITQSTPEIIIIDLSICDVARNMPHLILPPPTA